MIDNFNEDLQRLSDSKAMSEYRNFISKANTSRILTRKFHRELLCHLQSTSDVENQRDAIDLFREQKHIMHVGQRFGTESDDSKKFIKALQGLPGLRAAEGDIVNVGAGWLGVEPIAIRNAFQPKTVRAVDPHLLIDTEQFPRRIISEKKLFQCDARVGEGQGYNLKDTAIVVGGPCDGIEDVVRQCTSQITPVFARLCTCNISALNGTALRTFSDQINYLNSIKDANTKIVHSNSEPVSPYASPRFIITNIANLPEAHFTMADVDSNYGKSLAGGMFLSR